MPNWCHTHLIVGSAELKEVMELITDDKKDITFEKFLPTPPILLEQTSPTPKDADEKEIKRLIKKYGASDWYQWRCSNWGCKWDASRTSYINSFEVEFDTPWGPPIEFFRKLSEKFPKTEFKMQFADEFLGQYPLGEVTISDGEVYEWHEPKEGSSQAEKIADTIWAGDWAQIDKK